jgi:hypothetical protein
MPALRWFQNENKRHIYKKAIFFFEPFRVHVYVAYRFPKIGNIVPKEIFPTVFKRYPHITLCWFQTHWKSFKNHLKKLSDQEEFRRANADFCLLKIGSHLCVCGIKGSERWGGASGLKNWANNMQHGTGVQFPILYFTVLHN